MRSRNRARPPAREPPSSDGQEEEQLEQRRDGQQRPARAGDGEHLLPRRRRRRITWCVKARTVRMAIDPTKHHAARVRPKRTHTTVASAVSRTAASSVSSVRTNGGLRSPTPAYGSPRARAGGRLRCAGCWSTLRSLTPIRQSSCVRIGTSVFARTARARRSAENRGRPRSLPARGRARNARPPPASGRPGRSGGPKRASPRSESPGIGLTSGEAGVTCSATASASEAASGLYPS